MDSDSMFSLIVLFVLLLLSVFFSAAETAYSAANRIRLKNIAEEMTEKKSKSGARRANLALKLYDDFDRLLSGLLVGANIVNLSAASLCAVIFVYHFGEMGVVLSTAILTVIVIIFAEVSPKMIAKYYPEKVAILSADAVNVLLIMLTPANVFFIRWRKLLGKIFKIDSIESIITEDEIFSIVETAESDGTIDEGDRQLIHNALDFHHQQAKDILTHRMDVVAVSKDAAPEDIANVFMESGFSRLPMYDESIDHIVGILHMRDFFGYMMHKKPLHTLITPPVYVADSTNIDELFGLLQNEKSHMAIVSDEYGGTEGIVTMEDILEELVGEIWDESDTVEEKIVQISEDSYKVLCIAHMDDLAEVIGVNLKDIETTTVNAWIVESLGKIPQEGDSFSHENVGVQISKAYRRRALECIVTVNPISKAED